MQGLLQKAPDHLRQKLMKYTGKRKRRKNAFFLDYLPQIIRVFALGVALVQPSGRKREF